MADILTRREARQQAKQNRGYNRGQFQFAMANAKNALRRNSDLRGRELRQTARRMVAGVGEYAPSTSGIPSTFEEFINQPKYIGAPDQGGSVLARRAVQRGADKGIRISPIEAPVPQFGGLAERPSTTPTADLTNVGSFDNAFAMARKNGMKVFTWNGKKYGTNTDPNWRERWGRVKPKDGSSTAESDVTKPTSSNLNLTGKVDNWNISNILPEDIYNNLQNSIQSGIDMDIAEQEYQGIRNVVADNPTKQLKTELGRNSFMDEDGWYIGPWYHANIGGKEYAFNPIGNYWQGTTIYPTLHRSFGQGESDEIRVDPDRKTWYGVNSGKNPDFTPDFNPDYRRRAYVE